MDREKAQRAQALEGVLAIFINAVLFAVKFAAATATGSVALMADAWHTMSDSISSIFVVIAAKLASKKPDREHPFGHGRWELIASLFIAFLLGVVGYQFLADSIDSFQTGESVGYGTFALAATAASIIAKEALAQYAFYLGRRHDNPVISADGWHHRTDSLSSAIVLCGIAATKFIKGLWWMDSVLGAICALAIFYAAYKIMMDAITKILGEEPKKEFIDEVGGEIKNIYDGDLKLHHFHLHNYITHKELSLHMRLGKDMTIEKGHDIATAIEKMLKEKYGVDSIIHVEPLTEV